VKDGDDSRWIIIRRDSIDGQCITFNALMNQHQFASFLQPVFVPAIFHGQSNGFHLPFAGRQAIPRGIEIEVTRPQTIGTVVAVVDAREEVRAGNKSVTMRALEISKGGGVISHSSSRRCM
jgi:hypothetical protein